ncbi:hypothetical protein [Sunxiuqinia sp. sy24]|uniref:hypothetical protein n=1 Tax=Sunxiuqinia sp. sy24 TaxID=3461495 RepID=UPI00404687B1
MTEWSQRIAAQIEQELKGTKESDLRFMRVAEYLRMLTQIDEFSDSCPHCSQLKAEIEKEANTIRQAVTQVGRERRSYDKHIDKLARHLKKEHGFYPPYFYTYSYSFSYTAVAGLVGFLISLLFPSIDRWFFLTPGIVIGLLAGQFVGNRKDARIRSMNKLL